MILFRGSSSIALAEGAVRESFRAFSGACFGYCPLFLVGLDSSASVGAQTQWNGLLGSSQRNEREIAV